MNLAKIICQNLCNIKIRRENLLSLITFDYAIIIIDAIKTDF